MSGLAPGVEDTLAGVAGLAMLIGLPALVTFFRIRRFMDERRLRRRRRASFAQLEDGLRAWRTEVRWLSEFRGPDVATRLLRDAWFAGSGLRREVSGASFSVGEDEVEARFTLRALDAVLTEFLSAWETRLKSDEAMPRAELDRFLTRIARREARAEALIRRELGTTPPDRGPAT